MISYIFSLLLIPNYLNNFSLNLHHYNFHLLLLLLLHHLLCNKMLKTMLLLLRLMGMTMKEQLVIIKHLSTYHMLTLILIKENV